MFYCIYVVDIDVNLKKVEKIIYKVLFNQFFCLYLDFS